MSDDVPDPDEAEIIETCSSCGDSMLTAYLIKGVCGECRE